MANEPTAVDGVAGLVGYNWGIESGFDLNTDTDKRYYTPEEDANYPWPNGIFVEAPYPGNQNGIRLGTDLTADHLLLMDVTTAGLREQIMDIPDRQRVIRAGDPAMLLNINHEGRRLWLRLYPTGSETGAITVATAINTPLSINAVGRICIQGVGQQLRAHLKRNHIGAAYPTPHVGMIMVELVEKPTPHNLT